MFVFVFDLLITCYNLNMNSAQFVLRGGDTAFAGRQNLLLDQLSRAEEQCSLSKTDEFEMEVESSDHPSTIHSNRRTRQLRGKESIFKRPEAPPPRMRFRRIPDYHRNPQKWVKYSLEDVSAEDTSERSNTLAAFSFLKELRERSGRETEKRSLGPVDSAIRFEKPKETGATRQVDKAVFKSSKIVMPEYVVGQKRSKRPKKRVVNEPTDRKQLKLDHLQEEEEEEEKEDQGKD